MNFNQNKSKIIYFNILIYKYFNILIYKYIIYLMKLKKFNFYEKKKKSKNKIKGGFKKISEIQDVLSKIFLERNKTTNIKETINLISKKKNKIIFYKATESNKIKRIY